MAGHTENSIRINAPFALVWHITNDIQNWPDLFTEYARVDIVERQDDTVRFRLTMHPDEQDRVWSWVSERTALREVRTVFAHRVETGPFEYMHIRWRYTDDGPSTVMTWTQDFTMRPSAPVDDEGMVRHINANSAIQMDVIKKKVEEAARGWAQRPELPYRVVGLTDVAANRRRGGEVRTVLSPATVDATSGFTGAAIIAAGEQIAEHYHPYSEEFLYLVRGRLTVDLEGEPVPLEADQGLFIPIAMRHRLRNTGQAEAFAVFHLGPLAPRPELGHVDTESPANAATSVER